MALYPYNDAALLATAVLLVPNTQAGAPIRLGYYNLTNPNTTLAYVQFFDAAATSAVTPGTTLPTFFIGIPAFGGAIDTSPLIDFQFNKGIVVCATTTPTGNTAPSSAIPVQIFTK